MTMGGFLVETGDRKIVVDLGFGDRTISIPQIDGVFRGGGLLQNLERSGARVPFLIGFSAPTD